MMDTLAALVRYLVRTPLTTEALGNAYGLNRSTLVAIDHLRHHH